MDAEYLDAVALGQRNRTVKPSVVKQYLSRVRTIAKILWSNPELRNGLELDSLGNPTYYTGKADKIMRFKVPLTVEVARRVFAAIAIDPDLVQAHRRRHHSDENVRTVPQEIDEEAHTNPGHALQTITYQSYTNFKCSFKWFIESHRPEWEKPAQEWSKEVEIILQQMCKAYKKDVGSKKRNGIMPHKEGKSKYSQAGYFQLCYYFNRLTPSGKKNSWTESMFASLFTKISVNTIGRSDNVDDILLQNFNFVNDALTILFVTTKSDQCGERTSDVKRIYANPFNPEICLHLDLIIYIFCQHRSSVDECEYLFCGNDQAWRYRKALTKATESISPAIDLGCDRKDIGAHSNRKFAESMAVSRIDGPSRTQVCLRAGQSVGRTQDCYMSQEDDGDALVGRTLAQLKMNADEFDVLPPHFNIDTELKLEDFGWDYIYPGYSHHPTTFRRVIRQLFPTLVYHYHMGHLTDRCHNDHPIWRTRLFANRDLINSLRDDVILCHGHCTQTSMFAEGIPAVIQVSREVRTEAKKQTEYLKDVLINLKDIAKEMNEGQQEMVQIMKHENPQDVCDLITNSFNLDGQAAKLVKDIKEMLKKHQDLQQENQMTKMDAILSQVEALQNSVSAQPAAGSSTMMTNDVTQQDTIQIGRRPHLWPGDERLHRVPHNFRWPSDTAFAIWELWFFGNNSLGIGPYRLIENCDLPRKVCRTNKNKCAKLMSILFDIAKESSDEVTRKEHINKENSAELFDISYRSILQELYGSYPLRASEINVYTIANKWYKMHQ